MRCKATHYPTGGCDSESLSPRQSTCHTAPTGNSSLAGTGQRALGWAVPGPCSGPAQPLLPDALFHTLQGFNHPTEAAAITFLPMGLVAASTPVPAP